MKKLIYLILIFVVVGGAYGYYQWNRPLASNVDKTAEIIITASDLEAAYTSNESEANSKYNDKLVQVSGTISAIENEDGKPSVILSTQNPMANVICEFEKGASIGNIKVGDNVVVKGKPTGILSDVVLVQCVLIK